MKGYRMFAYATLLLVGLVITLKFAVWGYSFQKILPKESYEVVMNYSFDGFGEPVNVESFIPSSNEHQKIDYEQHVSGSMNLEVVQSSEGRKAIWESSYLNHPENLSYSFTYLGEAIKYNMDSSLLISEDFPPGIRQYLEPTKNIQSDHPFIQELYESEISNSDTLQVVLKDIHNFVLSLKSKKFKGLTDAVTAAKLQEASCNGKSRLFLALARNAGIPGKLVGGVILETGQKKTSHQWLEVYVNGYWVPFDALNNHFAFLPDNYMELYKGDEFLVKHSANINFDYSFTIKSRLVSNPTMVTDLAEQPFNAYQVWQAFEKVGIPLSLLTIIVMMPLGAFIVSLFRNVIGVKTFGVFLPALVAIACRETGFGVGMIAFVLVVLIVSLMHYPLEKWGILYTPKMVIMLVTVVLAILGISYLGMEFDIQAFAYVALFPMVVIAITAERFARTILEEGLKKAIQMVLQTLVVAFFTFLAMNSRTLEAMFLAMPELFLAILSLSLLLGKWIGIRVTEYSRFSWVLK
jgi:hypothetical protein